MVETVGEGGVAAPTPRMAQSRSISSSSDSRCEARRVGTSPPTAFSAMSRMAASLAPEKPQARIASGGVPRTSSGGGKAWPGNSARKRPRIASAARPCTCWWAMARTSAS